MTQDFSTESIAAAGLANDQVGVEAYRSVPFSDLPKEVVEQLQRDGTRGETRTLEEAQAVYEQNVPAEAKGSVEGVEAVTNDPTIDWMHKQPHSQGGSNTADNGVYGPEGLNSRIGDRAMTKAEVVEAEAFTAEVAEVATPGLTGDFTEVVGDTAGIGAMGGVLGAGFVAAGRMAQAQGFRDAGREDLAQMAESKIGEDAAKGAVNGVVRGTGAAVTQAVLGANPVTAGIGIMAPEIVSLVKNHESMTEQEKSKAVQSISGKCAAVAGLCALGPIGFLGVAGWGIYKAYTSAQEAKSLPRKA